MKKILLLVLAVFLGSQAYAQPDTVLYEEFERSSIISTLRTEGWRISSRWNDTTALSVSPNTSLHTKGTSPNTVDTLELPAFSSIGNPFVFFSYYQIAKLYLPNNILLQYRTSSTGAWQDVTAAYYRGPSAGFPVTTSPAAFHDLSYASDNNRWQNPNNVIPTNTWWKQELFDLTDIFEGPTGGGFAHCQLRFIVRYIVNHQNSGGFRAGAFLDNLLLIRSNCELIPPTLNIDYTGSTPPNGCINKPTNGVVQTLYTDHAVSVLAKDDTAGIDVVMLHYRKRSNGIWVTDTMTATTVVLNGQQEYLDSIPKVAVGDTVDWYISALDQSCPNRSRIPDSLIQNYYTFFPLPGYPFKCGSPYCGVLPTTVRTFPWTEDFEPSEFVFSSSGPGTFPTGDITGRYWTRNVNPPSASYVWSVSNGTTPTQLTGPSADHSANGNQYIYVEGGGGGPGTFANLVSPCIDLRNASGCLVFEFWYHMYGDQMGKLEVDLDTGSNTPSFTTFLTLNGQQQDSSSQEWKRGLLDLSPFFGKFIRIRFKATKMTGGERGDIAIDDMRIYTPPPADYEITRIVRPQPGACSYSSTEQVKVKFRYAGCSNNNFIPFAFRLNGGAVVRDTLFGTFGIGDTGTFTFTPTANMSAFQTHNLEIFTNGSTDPVRSNDTMVQTVNHVQPFSNFPYREYFESGTVGTRNYNFANPVFRLVSGQDPDFGLNVGQGLTPTLNTGPWRGYYADENSKYLYSSSTNPANGQTGTGNISTYFQSLGCLSFAGMSHPILTFAYHAYGANIQRIDLEYSNDPNGENWQLLPNSTLIPSGFSDYTDDWKIYKALLTPLANSSAKLRIKITRQSTGLASDFAMDNLFIYNQAPTDIGVSLIDRPNVSVRPQGNVSPRLRIENYGRNAVSSVPVTIEITDLCNNTTTTHTQTVVQAIGAHSTQASSSSALIDFTYSSFNPPLQFPVGAFEMRAYTTLAGDGISFNDTVSKQSIGLGYRRIGSLETFDSCAFPYAGYAALFGGLIQWEFGVPGPPFNSAFSTPNAWTTNREGSVFPGTTEILRTPDFYGFQNIVNPEFRFYHYRNFSSSAAGALEYLGATGWTAATGPDPTLGVNWYAGPNGELNNTLMNGPAWSANSNNWQLSWYPLDVFNFFPDTISMRFRFRSSAAASNIGGWALDNIHFYVPPQHSASPVRMRTIQPLPIPGNDQALEVCIQNTGAQLLRKFQYEVVLDPFTNPLALGRDTVALDSATIFLTRGRIWCDDYDYVIPAARATAGLHDVCIITYLPNDSTDDLTADDTLCTQIRILDEFIFDNGNNREYCNDFDGNLGTFEFFALNNYTYEIDPDRYSWRQGTPQQGPPGAYSAPNVWITYLDTNYSSRDSSALFTPVFVVEEDTNYEVSFMHWYETERATDGGTFMVSDDGGETWRTIGYAGEKNWYDTRFINALDIIKPGWSDTSGTWDTASYVFSFDQGDQVIFKFRFESDWDIEYKGWAIDNFCLSKTNKGAQFVIGRDEFKLDSKIFFGELAPNPAKHNTTLPFSIPNRENIDWVVTNLMGQVIARGSDSFEAGSNALQWETSDWSAGVYNINLYLGNEVVNRKLVVQ